MFLLNKNISMQYNSYGIYAGTKYDVKKKLDKEAGCKEEILKISSSDIESIKSIKDDDDMNKILNSLNKGVDDRTLLDLKRAILKSYLKYNSCSESNLQVCRKCGRMEKVLENRSIGSISLPAKDVLEILNTCGRVWACEDCRKAVFVVSWNEENNRKNYRLYQDHRNMIQKEEANFIRNGHKGVSTVIVLYPTFDDEEIYEHISRWIERSTIQQINNENKDNFYKGLLNLFIEFNIAKTAKSKVSLGLCIKCNHFVCKVCQEDWGWTSVQTDKTMKIIGQMVPWTCRKCQDSSNLILYKTKDGGYYTCHNTLSGRSVGSVLMELYPSCSTVKSLKKEVNETVDRYINEDKLRQGKKEYQLKQSVLLTFLSHINKKIKINNICPECRSITAEDGEELGRFWTEERFTNFTNFKSSIARCPFHRIKSVLFWNMSGWGALAKMKEDKMSALLDNDIIFLVETHLTTDITVQYPQIIRDKFLVTRVTADKSPRGRGKGGITMLVKRTLSDRHNELPYSDRGLFTNFVIGGEELLIGVLYWSPSTETEECTEEFNNLLFKYPSENRHVFIGGDFNGRIGTSDTQLDTQLKKQTNLRSKRNSEDKQSNKRGRSLMKSLQTYGYYVCNGRTPSDPYGSFTCHTYNGDSTVDYLLCSRASVPRIADMKVVDLQSTGTGYHNALKLILK